jgi:hypothetical protein
MFLEGPSASGGRAAYSTRECGRDFRALGACIRFPLLALLGIFEPVVRVLLCGFALLVVPTALLFKAAAPPRLSVPFWAMLGAAVAAMALLALYHLALRRLAG